LGVGFDDDARCTNFDEEAEGDPVIVSEPDGLAIAKVGVRERVGVVLIVGVGDTGVSPV